MAVALAGVSLYNGWALSEVTSGFILYEEECIDAIGKALECGIPSSTSIPTSQHQSQEGPSAIVLITYTPFRFPLLPLLTP